MSTSMKRSRPRGTVLVTGGAGYIGSHATHALADAGWRIVVLDNLSTGRRDAVAPEADLIEGDLEDAALLRTILTSRAVDAVMHFAASVVVPESVTDPLKYYRNNTRNTLGLIEACVACGVRRVIFSSTAAVYGAPDAPMVSENTPTAPINPYGRSKLLSEQMLGDVAATGALSYVALRYFNVAGADPQGRTGQSTPGATHLIKVACETVLGRRPQLSVFGTDYDTPDGTCVRDYIHVADLIGAHMAALERLMDGGESLTLNCGYGRGYSVREVLAAVAAAADRPVPTVDAARRPGDPPMLIADSARLARTLGWTPRHADLDAIVRSALEWERRLT